MTPEEERALFEVFLSEIDQNFSRMTDAEADEVVSAIKDATYKVQQAADAKAIWNSSLDYAKKQLDEEKRQEAYKKALTEHAKRVQEAEDLLYKERNYDPSRGT